MYVHNLQQWISSDILMDWDGPRWWWGMWPQTSSQGSVVLVWRFGQLYAVSIFVRLFFFFSVAFIGFYSSLCCIGNGFCFYDIVHLSITAPGNPLEFDTFNFSGVFRIVASCLCLCVAWFLQPKKMTKHKKYRNIEISRNLRNSFFFLCFGCFRCFGIEAPTPETPETHQGDQVPSFFQAGSHCAQWDLVWFGLGKDADSRLCQNKTWKKNETYVNKTNLLDGQERPSLGILDIIGKRMWPCPFFLGGGVPKSLQTALGL